MPRYAKGKRSYAISDRSGFKVRYRSLKTEWNNLRVEPSEYEPKHPQLTPPKNIIDAQTLFQPRPDNDPENISIFIGFNWFAPKQSMMASDYDAPPTIGIRAKGNVGRVSIEFNREAEVTGVAGGMYLVYDQQELLVDYSIGQTTTYNITVSNPGSGNKYYIDGVQQATMLLKEGSTYVFNWSSATSHPFRFSTTSDGTHGGGSEYTTGVVKDDSSYTTTITVASGAPTLYYYCSIHSGMGGSITTMATSVNATGNTGTESIETEQVVTGVAGTGAVASVGSNLGINIPETSVIGTGAIGTISIELDNPTWGVGTWGGGAWGQSLTTVDVSVTGIAATGNIGTETPTIELTETGVAGTGTTGSESITIITTSWGDGTWGADTWGE